MPYAKVNEINMYYEIHDEGEPYILISGMGGNVEGERQGIPYYAPEYQKIVFDKRGAGKTDKPDIPYSIEMMADDLSGLMDYIGIESAHIRGTSNGGMIALNFILKYPKRVRSLTLACTTCTGKQGGSPKLREIFSSFMQGNYTQKEMLIELATISVTDKYKEANPEFVNIIINSIGNDSSTDHVWRRYIEAQAEHDVCDRLHEIQVPTLIVSGDSDEVIPVKNAKLMASKIPNSELVIFKDTGHMMIESVGEVTSICLDFLRRNSKK